jgi:sulfur relay (sulfurtransferase) complex TusBCD TusD component (DsrE family)
MNVLVIVNDQPCGSERPYNALRLATALGKRDGVDLRVFLFGDAVMRAIARDNTYPRGTITSTACGCGEGSAAPTGRG